MRYRGERHRTRRHRRREIPTPSSSPSIAARCSPTCGCCWTTNAIRAPAVGSAATSTTARRVWSTTASSATSKPDQPQIVAATRRRRVCGNACASRSVRPSSPGPPWFSPRRHHPLITLCDSDARQDRVHWVSRVLLVELDVLLQTNGRLQTHVRSSGACRGWLRSSCERASCVHACPWRISFDVYRWSASIIPRRGPPGNQPARTAGRRHAQIHLMAEDVVAEIVATVLRSPRLRGSGVEVGDTLVLLESMKMEIPVLAEDAGTSPR